MTTIDEQGAALGAWLASRLGADDAAEVRGFDKPGSGFSAETVVFDAGVARGGTTTEERFVVRRETADPAVYPQQVPGMDVEIEIQYRIMDALGPTPVKVAEMVGYEADPGVLGAPFFVMRHVAGSVPVESPPYTESGFFVDATPDQRRQLIDEGLRMVASVHAVDHRAAGLEWLVAPGTTPGTAQQLAVWERYSERELGGRDHPLLAKGWSWLHAHEPAERPVGLCWGDPRPGNIIWQDFSPACLTDFEAASIAPAEVDLGWWLMFDRTMHESVGIDRLPGDPTRDEQRAMYERHAGRSVGDTYWYEVFAAARYCAIVVRVMNRMVARGHLPADNTIWLDNPASSALEQLLGE